MRKKQSQVIDGYTYTVTQLGAIEGRKLLVAISKIALPPMGALGKNANLDSLMQKDLSALSLDVVAQALANSLDEAAVDRITDKLVEVTEVAGSGRDASDAEAYGKFGDGVPFQRFFDDHFAGRPLAMCKWIAFAVKVQFGDFFDGRGGLSGLLSLVPQSASPATSIGPSGDLSSPAPQP